MPLRRTPPPASLPVPPQHHVSEPNIRDLAPHIQSDEPPSFVSTRNKRKHNDDLSTVKEEFAELFSKWSADQNTKFSVLLTSMNVLKEQNVDILKSIEFMSHKYDEAIKKLEVLEADRNTDRQHINFLENKIEAMERSLNKSTIELRNVPKNPTETKKDLTSIVQNLGEALNIPIQHSDLRDVFRINTKSQQNKPIIAELSNTMLRDNILKSIKSYNNQNRDSKFNTSNLKIDGPVKPVYVAEKLTYQAKKIYAVAREFAKSQNIAFCWISHGIVYLRKLEGSPAVRINCESDLYKVRAD